MMGGRGSHSGIRGGGGGFPAMSGRRGPAGLVGGGGAGGGGGGSPPDPSSSPDPRDPLRDPNAQQGTGLPGGPNAPVRPQGTPPVSLENFDAYQRDWERRLFQGFSDADRQYLRVQFQKVFENNGFYMNIDSRFLENVADEHFKNQFETGGRSGGAEFDASDMTPSNGRVNAAIQLFGLDYTKMKPGDYEKYGSMQTLDLATAAGRSPGSYGDALVRFKKENLWDRTTYTLGDSLGPAYSRDLVAGKISDSQFTGIVWRETMLTHLLLWGNSYSQIIRSGRGKIIGLYPLLPDHMEVDRDEKSGNLTYTYSTTKGETVRLRPEDVLHIPGLGFDGIMGYSPIAVEKNAIGLGIAAEEYGSKFFSNGATPSGILTHPNTVKNPKALREAWMEAYGGSSNSNRVAILEEGMTFTRISLPNNEAQFLETRKFQVSEICRIYRVPPHMIGDLDRATFSNIENQSISFAVHTIRPWLVRIEQAMNRTLFPEKEKGIYYVQFNLDGLMRGDYKSRMEGYAIGRQNGWLNANDIRALENMNPIPEDQGGNVYLVNGNMIPIHVAAQAKVGSNISTTEPQQTAKEAQDDGSTAAESNYTSGGLAGDRAADHTVDSDSRGHYDHPMAGPT